MIAEEFENVDEKQWGEEGITQIKNKHVDILRYSFSVLYLYILCFVLKNWVV